VGVLQLRTSEPILLQKIEEFSKIVMFMHRNRFRQCGHFATKERRINFLRFCADVFYGLDAKTYHWKRFSGVPLSKISKREAEQQFQLRHDSFHKITQKELTKLDVQFVQIKLFIILAVLRSVYAKRDRGFAAFAKEWSK